MTFGVMLSLLFLSANEAMMDYCLLTDFELLELPLLLWTYEEKWKCFLDQDILLTYLLLIVLMLLLVKVLLVRKSYFFLMLPLALLLKFQWMRSLLWSLLMAQYTYIKT